MKPPLLSPLLRSALVAAIALAGVVLLSACLANSAPTPVQTQATPTQGATASAMPASAKTAQPSGPAVDLALSVGREGNVAPSAMVRYHLSYENADDEREAAGVVVRVSLPEGASLVASSKDDQPFPPRAQGTELEYALGNLAAGDWGRIDMDVQLPARLVPGSTLAYTARISGAGPDPDEENNYTEDTEEIPAPDVAVAVRPAGDEQPVVPGRTLSYLLSYGNNAEVEAPSVAINSVLAAGMTHRAAYKLVEERQVPLAPQVKGAGLSFDLGTLAPGAYGDLLVEVALEPGLLPDTPITYTASISTLGEVQLDDNTAEDVQWVQVEGPDVWVELDTQTEGEVDGSHSYSLYYGNRGTQDADGVVVSLAIPTLLKDVTFATPPDSYANGTATWNVGRLAASTQGEGLYVVATIGAVGTATARASVRMAGQDADSRNDAAEASDELVTLHMPTIAGPAAARVGDQPVVFGFGKPGATVALYVAAADEQKEQPWGKAVVDEEGRWEITPTTKLKQPGWYWFMATQELDGRVSPLTGVGNYYSDQLLIDTNSLTVNGERVGGIDQDLDWVASREMTFGARIIACAQPLTPTLQVRYYNAQGLMINHEKIQPKLTRPDGYVEFDFKVPDEGEDVQWQIELGFYCREEAATTTIGRSPGLASRLQKGWTDIYKPGCWFGGCGNDDEPDPPKPKPQCPGCSPIPKPKPKPRPKDPDGFVYDEALVKAGAKMTQAIISSAWVTCTRRTEEGEFEPWNAMEYNQANPQFTDGKYPDKVLRPGYYSFLVPPGSYRIQATAPGYLPYESSTLQVVDSPVTLHIPLKRARGGIPKALGNKSP